MNRTRLRKYLYLGLLTAIFTALLWLYFSEKISVAFLFGIALGLLLLGRIINYPLRNFYQGLTAFQQQKFEAAAQLFHNFLDDVKRRPWIKKLIWWSFGVYTYDLEAMAWNNLGAIEIEKGRFATAPEFLNKALALDPNYPKPYFNLAIAAIGQSETELAEQYFQKARDLGFTNDSFDRFLGEVQQTYAGINAKFPR